MGYSAASRARRHAALAERWLRSDARSGSPAVSGWRSNPPPAWHSLVAYSPFCAARAPPSRARAAQPRRLQRRAAWPSTPSPGSRSSWRRPRLRRRPCGSSRERGSARRRSSCSRGRSTPSSKGSGSAPLQSIAVRQSSSEWWLCRAKRPKSLAGRPREEEPSAPGCPPRRTSPRLRATGRRSSAPQKLWQSTVSVRPATPDAIGRSRCSSEWSLQSCQPISRTGIAMTIASRRIVRLSARSRADPGDQRSDDVSTTSNAEPGTRPSVCRSSFDQRGSGAPETYQSDPLSATIIP